MAAAFKIGAEEHFHKLDCFVVAQESSGQSQHVSVVVASCEACNFRGPAKGRAYALVLIERHVDAFAATADANSGVTFATFYGFCAEVCKIGVITAVFALGAEVFVGDSLRF